MEKRVLCFTDYFLPSYRAGGPIKSLANMLSVLKDDFEFLLITRNHDFISNTTYDNVETDIVNKRFQAEIIYLNEKHHFFRKVFAIIKRKKYDLIYFNSFFSFYFTIMPYLFLKLIHRTKKSIVFAPRGEFSMGALKIKSCKKMIYIKLVKCFGLVNNIMWHATSDEERSDIQRVMGSKAKITIIPNIIEDKRVENKIEKESGLLKIVFLSRITRKKNLLFALKVLKNIKGNVIFDIYGVKEDLSYWHECEKIMDSFPVNVKVNYRRVVLPENVSLLLADYDLFFLPTLGENFGHAILEALLVGCPVLLSNLTPWKNLQKYHAGWAFPLIEKHFSDVINNLISLSKSEFRLYTSGARAYIEYYLATCDATDKTKVFFSSID